MIAAYLVAVTYKGSLVYLLLMAYGPVVQFMPAVIATLYWRRATGPAVLDIAQVVPSHSQVSAATRLCVLKSNPPLRSFKPLNVVTDAIRSIVEMIWSTCCWLAAIRYW